MVEAICQSSLLYITPVGSPLGTVRTLVTKSNSNGSPAFAEQKVYKVSYEQP